MTDVIVKPQESPNTSTTKKSKRLWFLLAILVIVALSGYWLFNSFFPEGGGPGPIVKLGNEYYILDGGLYINGEIAGDRRSTPVIYQMDLEKGKILKKISQRYNGSEYNKLNKLLETEINKTYSDIGGVDLQGTNSPVRCICLGLEGIESKLEITDESGNKITKPVEPYYSWTRSVKLSNKTLFLGSYYYLPDSCQSRRLCPQQYYYFAIGEFTKAGDIVNVKNMDVGHEGGIAGLSGRYFDGENFYFLFYQSFVKYNVNSGDYMVTNFTIPRDKDEPKGLSDWTFNGGGVFPKDGKVYVTHSTIYSRPKLLVYDEKSGDVLKEYRLGNRIGI